MPGLSYAISSLMHTNDNEIDFSLEKLSAYMGMISMIIFARNVHVLLGQGLHLFYLLSLQLIIPT